MTTLTTTQRATAAELIVLLNWLAETLPGPKMPRAGTDTSSGFTKPEGKSSTEFWHDCEQCHDGQTKRGPCTNCDGAGGWHYDPMDETRAALLTTTDAHPENGQPTVRIVRTSTQTDENLQAWREWGEQYGYDPVLPSCLRQLAAALDKLRHRDRYQRAVLQRVYLIRLGPLRECDQALHDGALRHLAALLPAEFQVPRWVRKKAAGANAA